MQQSHKAMAGIALAASASGWALAPIFIRVLSPAYDTATLNFLRYGSATIPLLLISIFAYRGDLIRSLRFFSGMGAVALINVVEQWMWTVGCANSVPTTAQLISKLSIVFIILFSFVMFREERAVIKSPLYIFGTLLSFLGVAAVISDDPATIIPVLDMPTLMLLGCAVMWGVYTVSAKHVVANIHPLPMFAVVSAYETVVFGALAFTTGNPATVLTAGPWITFIAVISGLICIAMSHTSFHFAQKHLGSSLCSSVSLFNPLITYPIALLIWPTEHMVLTQWIGAGILTGGTLLVMYAGRKAHRPEQQEATEAGGLAGD